MSAEACLSLEDVSKSYWRGPRETPVLRDVSLSVHEQECVAIWGQRASGKTTLLKVAAGVEVPDRGVVRFMGRELSALSGSELARLLREEIGWARRGGPGSDELQVLDYVALPLLKGKSMRIARRSASAMLDRVGVGDCARARWEDLTDGERTLVSIAHAMVRQPSVLVVDDPTANLDLIQGEQIMSLLRRAADEGGLCVLLTVPDMPSMVHAHRVGSLSDGRLMVSESADGDRDNVVRLSDRGRRASG